jgi:hypothetical protein
VNRRVYISLWPIYGVACGLAFMASSTAGVWVAIIGACALAMASSVMFRGRRRPQP